MRGSLLNYVWQWTIPRYLITFFQTWFHYRNKQVAKVLRCGGSFDWTQFIRNCIHSTRKQSATIWYDALIYVNGITHAYAWSRWHYAWFGKLFMLKSNSKSSVDLCPLLMFISYNNKFNTHIMSTRTHQFIDSWRHLFMNVSIYDAMYCLNVYTVCVLRINRLTLDLKYPCSFRLYTYIHHRGK